jgi:hypothetical protein
MGRWYFFQFPEDVSFRRRLLECDECGLPLLQAVMSFLVESVWRLVWKMQVSKCKDTANALSQDSDDDTYVA